MIGPVTLLRHRINALNAHLTIERTSGRGDPCNEGRVYQITTYIPETRTEPLFLRMSSLDKLDGVTDEALLAVVLDRLECSQRHGAIQSRERALAITKIEEALQWLRTEAEHGAP